MINALRMRPDRIVVGEVRGEEALDMLQAMNTGHDGSLTTIHANTPRDALSRIETMIAMGDVNLPEKAMRQQIAAGHPGGRAADAHGDGSRKVTSISEITGMEGDVITMQEIFLFEKIGVTQDGKVIGRFRATGVRPKCCERLKRGGHPPAARHVRRRDGGPVMAQHRRRSSCSSSVPASSSAATAGRLAAGRHDAAHASTARAARSRCRRWRTPDEPICLDRQAAR